MRQQQSCTINIRLTKETEYLNLSTDFGITKFIFLGQFLPVEEAVTPNNRLINKHLPITVMLLQSFSKVVGTLVVLDRQ